MQRIYVSAMRDINHFSSVYLDCKYVTIFTLPRRKRHKYSRAQLTRLMDFIQKKLTDATLEKIYNGTFR